MPVTVWHPPAWLEAVMVARATRAQLARAWQRAAVAPDVIT